MKLTDPYPNCPSYKSSLAIAFFISMFVVAFLGFFQPFDLHMVQGNVKFWFIAGYGIINFLVILINLIVIPSIFPSLFEEKNWKVYKELLWVCWMLFTIGLGNFLYTKLLFNYPDSYLMGFLQFQLYTLAVGIFPTIVLTIINYNQQLRKNLELAGNINESMQDLDRNDPHTERDIKISSDNQKESLQLPLDDVLFIQSEGNYILIYYRKDQDIKRSILRNTLKNAEDELGSFFPPLFKTHRSYIVNLSLVKKIKGNSQGLQLYLPELEEFIPVSRAYIKKLRDTI